MYSIILAVALLFGLAQAQTTSSLTTSASRASSYLTVLGGNDYMTSGVAASIISADVCHTTYAIQCTARNGCGSGQNFASSGLQVTVTEAPWSQQLVSTISSAGATVGLSALCNVSGRTSATCTVSISVAYGGQSTSSVTTTTIAAKYASIPLTAGTLPTGSCTSTAAGALPTAYADMYKVVIVPAAALAMAALV